MTGLTHYCLSRPGHKIKLNGQVIAVLRCNINRITSPGYVFVLPNIMAAV